MNSASFVDKLHEASEMARQMNMSGARAIFRELVEQTKDSNAQQLAALGIINHSFFEDFRAAVAALSCTIDSHRPDPSVLSAYAFACFVLDDFSESIRVGREALKAQPQNWLAMKNLGMAYMCASQPLDAFLAFSSGMLTAPPNVGIAGYRDLALRLLTGGRIATVVLDDGQQMRFHLRVDNGQMLEAAAHHSYGILTETEELRLIRQHVQSNATLIEVGTLVGNHLVYFLKALKPKKAIVFDISARSIQACRENVLLNEPYTPPTEIIFRPIGISNKTSTTTGPDGRPTEITSLDEAVDEQIDFIKIDVDGREIEALQGARALIARCRPQIMIEIARENELDFKNFLEESNYRVVGQIDRGLHKNYLVASAR